MAICQANAAISQLIEIDNLLRNPKIKVDFSDFSDNN